MRTLTIAGLAMVTAITATQASAQRTPSNGQSWHGGRSMPSATAAPAMPSRNQAPGVTWAPGPVSHNAPPAMVPPSPQVNAPPPRVSNPGFRNGQRNGQWTGNRQTPGNRQWSGSGQWSGNGQRHGGNTVSPLPGYRPIQAGQRQHRWGGSVGGRWYGGSNAPGGWKSYRRPTRGWTLPRYWVAPSFFIGDYGLYGLSTPPYGYNWTRYYDDAVLMDGGGRVYDSVNGIDWDSYDDGYGYGDADDRYAEDSGYGVAEGNADYGYSSGSGDSGGYGASYARSPVVQGDYSTSYSSGAAYAGSGGYVSGGYWYPPVTTTTITVQSAPVVTTTTTEYIETASYRPARRVYYAPKRKTKVRICNCR